MKTILTITSCLFGSLAWAQPNNVPASVRDQYVYIGTFEQGVAPVRNADCRWGLIDKQGKEVLQCHFDQVESRKGVLIQAKADKNTQYWLNSGGKMQALQYEQVELAMDSFLVVKTAGQWGVMTTQGAGVVLLRYEGIRPTGNYWQVRMQMRYGILTKDGKELFKTDYQMITHWKNAVFIAQEKDKYKLINIKKEVLSAEYDEVGKFSSNGDYLPVRQGDRWGVLGVDGKEYIAPKYLEIQYFGGDKLLVRTEDEWLLLSPKGERLTSTTIKNWKACMGLALQTKDGKWGIFFANAPALPFEYSECRCEETHNHLLVRNAAGKWGVLLANGNWLVQPEFDDILSLDFDNAAVQRNGEWSVYQFSTKQHTKTTFQAVRRISGGFIAVQIAGKWGAMDSEGRLLLPPDYDEVESYSSGIFKVKQNGKTAYITTDKKTSKCE